MTHARKQIRDQIVTTLTGLATTGSNVFASRMWPMAEEQMPGLIVYTVSEDSEAVAQSSSGYTLGRVLNVSIDAYVAAAVNVDDLVDQIAVEIEEALAGDAALDALVERSVLTRTEIILEGNGEHETAITKFQYEIRYRTAANDVEQTV